METFSHLFHDNCTLVNGLGATETELTTQHFIGHGEDAPDGAAPLGKPVLYFDIELIDAERRLLPQGIHSEVQLTTSDGFGITHPYPHSLQVLNAPYRNPSKEARIAGNAQKAAGFPWNMPRFSRGSPPVLAPEVLLVVPPADSCIMNISNIIVALII